ncbi:MAG TPA: hypothetical protein DCX14_06865 [Flavobacteriales bacterium]|nr:hypothetical protein [Flavobacteriales bacterium]
MRWILPCLIALLFGGQSFGQRSVRDSTLSFASLGAHVGMQYPFANLSERFGYGGIAGAELMIKKKKNFTIELEYGYIFGSRVKEDTILQPLLTSQNFIVNREGEPADVFLAQRGFITYLKVGKIFPVFKANPNSGIHATVGFGYMQHKINITEASQKVPQLIGDYLKGYDRFTNGFLASQSFGYSHFSDYKLVNYYIGVEFVEGFTQNRRAINFDTGVNDPTKRMDVMGSMVFRWYFPIYKRQPQEFYFY